MKITRRQLFLYCAAGLSSTSYPIFAATSERGWRYTCKTWMSKLLPPNEYGPGADTPIVWKRLEELLEKQPGTRQWLLLGLKRLENQPLPETQQELLKMQKTGQPYAPVIRYLRKLFIEYYYASEHGWRELGFTLPPQPKGFSL